MVAAAIQTTVQYSAPPTEPLRFNVDDRSTNICYIDTPVLVHDARPLKGTTSLDRQGFEIHHMDTRVASWDDEADVKAVYYEEAVQLVKKATGAKHITVFDHTFRRVGNSKPGRPKARGPAKGVHVDYTPASAVQRLRDVMGEDVAKLSGRFAIVNLWRPVNGTVYDVPLGILDATTVSLEDLSPYSLIYPDRVGETQTVHSNPTEHRWYYLPHQEEHEVLLFKQYDSDPLKTRFTPHSAFQDPTVPPPGTFKPRESIELRLFVFFDADQENILSLQI